MVFIIIDPKKTRLSHHRVECNEKGVINIFILPVPKNDTDHLECLESLAKQGSKLNLVIVKRGVDPKLFTLAKAADWPHFLY